MSKIYLRELTDSDVNESYLEGFTNELVTEFLEVNGNTLTRADVINYINLGKTSRSYFMYAICTKDTDSHIGNLKIGPINYDHMTSDLVTVIWDKSYWGKGLATESIKLGNEMAFNTYNIRKLHGGMYANNIGSIKAYTKAGWIVEGTLQSHYRIDGKYQDRIMVSCFNPNFKSDL